MTTDRSVQWPERLYAALFLLYPPEFRRRFGSDMRQLFVDRWRVERRRSGWRGIVWLWFVLLPDILGTAARERSAAAHQWFMAGAVPRPHDPARSHGDTMFEKLMQDLRYAVRMVRKSPAFTMVAMLVIALGSGAVTTIFSAANALLLRPIPGVADPGQLVNLTRTVKGPGRAPQTASYPLYLDLRDRSRILSGVAAWSPMPLTLSQHGSQGTSTYANIVSGTYFAVLGVR
ncbi:MAG: hypothetical protein ACREL5_12130, partial [Gemmatimonadales bacterium]